jgi:lysyl-tRNA synthetase class 2
MYNKIRQFFAQRNVLEVETPILSQAGVTDVHLASVQVQRHIHGKLNTQYLQTSPEFPMKRLLASGSGAIYQICKVFRDDEHGRKHNSEFTMLEWYRPGLDLKGLMHETADLLEVCLAHRFGEVRPYILSYKHAFQDRLDINPLQASLKQLKETANRVGLNLDLGNDRLGYMDLYLNDLEKHAYNSKYTDGLHQNDVPNTLLVNLLFHALNLLNLNQVDTIPAW